MSDQHFGRDSANEILAAWRKALHEWELATPGSREEDEAAERMGSAGGAMDDLLSHGGELPDAWNISAEEKAALRDPAVMKAVAAAKTARSQPGPRF